MKHSSSLGRTTLAFSIGSVGLASAFVLIIAGAVLHAGTSHGTPTATDYQFGAEVLLLLIAGFFMAVTAAARATLPIPSARTGFFAGIAGAALLLSVMMLVGGPLGVRGPLVVAVLVGIASAAGAIRLGGSRRLLIANTSI